MKKRPCLPWDDEYVSVGMPGGGAVAGAGGGLAELESRLLKELELEKEKEKAKGNKEAGGEAEKGGEAGQGVKEGMEKEKKSEEEEGRRRAGKPGSKERELFAVQVMTCFLTSRSFFFPGRVPGTTYGFTLYGSRYCFLGDAAGGKRWKVTSGDFSLVQFRAPPPLKRTPGQESGDVLVCGPTPFTRTPQQTVVTSL